MKTIAPDALYRLMRDILRRRGLSSQHAEDVAGGLLRASLRGVDTHGVVLFPLYVRELEGGRAQARPTFKLTDAGKAGLLLDAGGALGVVAGMEAAREAVRRARETGVATVAVANSNHFAAASIFTLAIADQDMLGFSFSNSDALTAPHGGKRKLFGTNPLSFTAPCASGEPFCVDMATSQVAYSKIRARRQQGLAPEPGWAVAADGRDAAEAGEDWRFMAMKPLGGYKGQCLNMTVGLLCALLTGMPFDHELTHLFEPPYDRQRQVSHVLMAVNLGAFQDLETAKRRLQAYLDLVRDQEPAGDEAVIAPGDLERREMARRQRDGIALAPKTLDAFLDFHRELEPGRPFPFLEP